MLRNLSSIVCLLVLGAIAGGAQDPSERFYQAIRNNDLPTLRTLVKSSDVISKTGTNPLP